jgi:O-antigen ligase
MNERTALHSQLLLRWSAIALGASIPVSTALDNVLLVVTTAAFVFSGQLPATKRRLLENKSLLLPLLLFAALAMGTLYGDSPLRSAWAHLWKYADLLFIPVFALAFQRPEMRQYALWAFAGVLGVTLILSYLLHFALLPKMPFMAHDGVSPTIFKLKITHNFLMAFGAFVFLWLARTAADGRLRIVCYLFAGLAAINVLLMVQGATGYVILAALGVLWICERIGMRTTGIAALVMLGVSITLMLVPNTLQRRAIQVQQEIQLWRSGNPAAQDTSTGQRLEYYSNTLAIIKEHSFIGIGTGGFPTAYARQVKGTGKQETQNPHNEFLNITAQVGMGGLALLIAMFWLQWHSASRLETPMKRSLMRALVLTMVSGCLFNSLLLDHAEGLFYAWMSGLLYGGLKYAPPDKPPAPA